MEFAYPLVIFLISPVALAGWYAVRRGVPRLIIISRVIILSLLIIALASPFTLETRTIRDEAPRVTVLSDQTMSMDLFNKDTGEKIFESIKTKTPTLNRTFAGIKSPIGDEVIAAAENNNIVLVSDGNNNYGKDLFDAITFVSQAGTRVFAVRQKPQHNDASVEIVSAKNLIVGNENVFNIVVRQAGDEMRYRLDVDIDGASLPSENIVQTERTKIIPVSYTFNSLGTHKMTATITPSGEDWFSLNNVFYKSVFVVPKPKVIMITDDTTTPLYTIAGSLYETTASGTLPEDITPYKALIIDNKGAGLLSANVDALRTYVGSGGGMVVVGGDSSYDRGSYNNSPVEALLPTISRAAEFRGGKYTVVVIDSSGSTAYGDVTTGISFISLIDANAINIAQNIGGDGNLGVVAFGGGKAEKTDMLSMGSAANRENLANFIKEIGPQTGDITTDLDVGLRAADELLKPSSGTKEIIVLSDGQMPRKGEGFEQIKSIVEDLTNEGIKIHLVQVLTSPSEPRVPNPLYDELAKTSEQEVIVLYPNERVSTVLGITPSITATPTETPEAIFEYPLVAVDTNHFITKYLNLTASVTGYNDVTPKLGAEQLVATNKGKPVLTTWGFGLGRVAAFTTDNGGGNTRWASSVYSGENSRLVSAVINWAIGDPRPREGVVVQAEDMWAGTPGKVVVTSPTLPQVNLDGTALDLSRTGTNIYEATINPEKEGFHDLSGYGVAVNYPLEYREVGFNEKLSTVIESNGGRVYNEDDVEGLLLLDIKEKSVRQVQEPASEKEPFLLAALILFLGEVMVRRIKDYGKKRPQIQ